MFKVGDIVESVGYKLLKDEDKEKNLWPEFLPKGVHKVSKVKNTMFGQLVKLHSLDMWLHYRWFKLTSITGEWR